MKLLPPDQYQPAADASFKVIANRVSATLPDAQIEHVGASSIPGAYSKGDLDACVIVGRDRFAAALERLLALGYAVKADTLCTDQLCMLVPISQVEDHAIQLVEADSRFQFFLTFRDVLRNDPQRVARYNEVKLGAASQSEQEYRRAKSAFIAEVLKANEPHEPPSVGEPQSAAPRHR
jgi:GrpB-like predicted nucleotidyltransferase (UPF0157 family)